MDGTDLTPDHFIDTHESNIHYEWSRDQSEIAVVQPGEVVQFKCRDASNGQLGPSATTDDLKDMIWKGHPLTGPVHIAGAKPGDVLVVDLLDFEHHGHGFTYFYPREENKGILPEEFEEHYLYVWDLSDRAAQFVNGISIPIDPFPGAIGVAPKAAGPHDTVPPRDVGGNIDIKHLTAGSTLYLPVEVEGGVFSVGDCHAAQGDGEVCVTGIEAPMTVTARFNLARDMCISQPEFITSGPFSSSGAQSKMYATSGIADELMAANKKAISNMISYLHNERDLKREEAYILCSVAADLKINQVVNAPKWTVSAYIPESIFSS